jgi:hypothetical protein
MGMPQRLSTISAARQALVRLFQATDYGEIQGLTVHAGEPSFNPQPVVVQDIKLDQDAGRRHESELDDFALSAEVIRLFRQLDEIGSGCIDRIVVAAGIPRRVIVRRPLTEAPR